MFRFPFSFVLFPTLLIVSSAILPVAPLRAQESAPAAANASALLPKEGEIALTGTLQNVDWKLRRLEILASSFTLPSGKDSAIEPAKAKIILLPLEVSPFVRDDILRGDLTRAVKPEELKTPLSILVIGRDSGTGQPLAARVVAVWDSVENGRFVLESRLKAAATETKPVEPVAPTEPAVPDVAAPETNDAVPPPVVVEVQPEVALPNQVLKSDFEMLGDDVRASDWDFTNREGTQFIENDEGHYVSLNTKIEQRKISRKLEISPDWKTLKLSARVRGQDLKVGTEEWATAHIGFVFSNDKNEIIGYGWPVTLINDTDWKKMSGVVAIPEGTTSALLDAGNFGADGIFDIDDIVVQHDIAPDALVLKPGFPEGDFETMDEQGQPLGWPFGRVPGVSVVEENDNHFLRIANPPPSHYVGFESPWQLDPKTKSVRISARMRVRDLKKGVQPWDTARIGLAFNDAAGERAGEWPPSLELHQDSDWQTLSLTLPVPKGAVFFKITPQFINANGVLDIDDIKIEQIK